MRVSIVPLRELDEEQRSSLWKRINDPEHQLDTGPCSVWSQPAYEPNIFTAGSRRISVKKQDVLEVPQGRLSYTSGGDL